MTIYAPYVNHTLGTVDRRVDGSTHQPRSKPAASSHYARAPFPGEAATLNIQKHTFV